MSVWSYNVKVTRRYGDNRPIWIFVPASGAPIINYMTFAPVAGDTIVFNLDTTGIYVFDSNFVPTMFNTYPAVQGQPVGPTNLITFTSVTSPQGAPTPAYPSQGFTLTLSVVAQVPTDASTVSITLYALDGLGSGALHGSPDPSADPQPTRPPTGG